jgi:Na+/proline symporter
MNRLKKSLGQTNTRTIVWFLIISVVLFIAVASLLYLNGSDYVWGFNWLVFVTASILFFSLFFLLGFRIAQREGYLDGFTVGRDHGRKLKRKKK